MTRGRRKRVTYCLLSFVYFRSYVSCQGCSGGAADVLGSTRKCGAGLEAGRRGKDVQRSFSRRLGVLRAIRVHTHCERQEAFNVECTAMRSKNCDSSAETAEVSAPARSCMGHYSCFRAAVQDSAVRRSSSCWYVSCSFCVKGRCWSAIGAVL